MTDLLRKIPKVDDILKNAGWRALIQLPESLTKDMLREVLDELRAAIRQGETDAIPSIPDIIEETKRRTVALTQPTLRKVINGTGVIIHTNLGRSPLAPFAVERLTAVASGYSNLEYDLVKGERGDRYEHCLSILTRLTGAESALIVNNNAAAVLLVLNTLSEGKEVIISRGELIEIGGSFRIPEVMEKSGAVLREVGTTNRTFIEDYERAVNERTGLLMKAHTSNYRIRGFVHEAGSEELANLAVRRNIPFYFDTGSGLLSPFQDKSRFSEPSIVEEVGKKVDIISFSGDKLLGGPQAGIILGKSVLVHEMKNNPLTRALRPDKFTLSALEATLLLYLEPEKATREIPILRMLFESEEKLRKRAARIARLLRRDGAKAAVEVVSLQSEVGGGSLPDTFITSFGISVSPSGMSVQGLEQKLREQPVPVIARIEKDRLLIDMRTVREEDEALLASEVAAVLQDGR